MKHQTTKRKKREKKNVVCARTSSAYRYNSQNIPESTRIVSSFSISTHQFKCKNIKFLSIRYKSQNKYSVKSDILHVHSYTNAVDGKE